MRRRLQGPRFVLVALASLAALVMLSLVAGFPGAERVANAQDGAQPDLAIVKTAVPGPQGQCPSSFDGGVVGQGDPIQVDLDDFVTYCIAVRNTGAGNADEVSVSDAQAVDVFVVGDLGPGETYSTSYDVQVGLATDLLNTAVVTWFGPDPDLGPQTATDTAIIELIDTRVASLELIHSVSRSDEPCVMAAKNLNSLVADEQLLPITWCAKVTNTGNVALTRIILQAPDIAEGGVIAFLDPDGFITLLPGESASLQTAGTIPDTGLISRAGAEAQPSDAQGNPLVDLDKPFDADNATVIEASIQMRATVTAGPNGDCDESVESIEADLGDTVTWCYSITNTGSTVLLVDEIIAPSLGTTISIPDAAQRLAITDSIVVAIDRVVSGSVVANALVLGQPIGFDDVPLEVPPVQDSDTAELTINGQPASGDVDCNGQIDGRDALVVSQFVAGTRSVGPCPHGSPNLIDLQGADVTQDGSVDNDDALALLECLVSPAGCIA